MKKPKLNLIVFSVMIVVFFTFPFFGANVLRLPKIENNNLYISKQTHNTTTESVYLLDQTQYIEKFAFSNNTQNGFNSGTGQKSELEKELEKNTSDQLNLIDVSAMQALIDGLSEENKNLFGKASATEKIKQILSGDFKMFGDNAFKAVINMVFSSFAALVPLMASIVAIGVLSGMLNQMRSKQNGKSLGDIIHFVCYGLILVLITSSVYKLLNLASSSLAIIKGLIDAIFPILLTLLTAVGGSVSASVYQPAVALLSGSVLQVFNNVLVPIFIFSFVFSIISNFSVGIKLEKFTSFFNSLFKWIVGSVFTVFMAFITIQGLTAGSFDGISIKTAKFAMKSSIPIVGGYLADGFNLIIASSVLIKNAIGVSGLILLFLNVLSPIIAIVVFSLFCKLTASILEPLTDGRISNFLFGVSKTLTQLLAILIAVTFMFLILTSLVMFSANFI